MKKRKRPLPKDQSLEVFFKYMSDGWALLYARNKASISLKRHWMFMDENEKYKEIVLKYLKDKNVHKQYKYRKYFDGRE